MLTKNKIKFINSLSQKKNRVKNNCFLVEGDKIVVELIKSDFKIRTLYTTKKWLEENKENLYNLEIITLSNLELKKISQLSSPNNVLAIVEKKDIIFKSSNLSGITLVLDQISDPGNLGTIIRLCDWFGIKNIICSENSVDYLNTKVIQSTMGSIFRVNIFYKNLVSFFKQTKFPVYGACLDGVNIKSHKIESDCFILMGNESNGIAKELECFINTRIKIPNNRRGAESLNVACATSIFLYQYSI